MPTLSGGYTASEIMKMQRDAEARVREMQRRARRQVTSEEKKEPPPKPPAEIRPQKPSPKNDPPFDFLSGILKDDKLLILVLLFILIKNECDQKLILALLYLLL